MRDFLDKVVKSDGVTLQGRSCDGDPESIWLIGDGEGRIVAMYGVSFYNEEYGHSKTRTGVYDYQYCYDFKESDILAAFDKLRDKRLAKEREKPHPEQDTTAVEPEPGLTADDPVDQS